MKSVASTPTGQSDYTLSADGHLRRIRMVDDNAANRQLLVLMLKQSGFRTLTAKDGMEATRRIKAQAGDRWIPIIFVTAFSDQDVLAECLAAGGDDFVAKPINLTILMARLEARLRIGQLYWEQYEQRRELAYYRDMMERERNVAERIFRGPEHSQALTSPGFRHCLSPMSVFNGDLLLAEQTPDGGTLLLIGDFTGHGLAAAIGALPTSDIFFAMCAKGFSLVDIISEINDRLLKLLPVEMFLALCGLEISEDRRTLRIWSGGIPDIAVRRVNGDLELLRARHLPLGVVKSSELESSLDTLVMAPGDLAYLYTDGVIETLSPGGELFGADRLMELIGSPMSGAESFEGILQALNRFRAGEQQGDDLTLLQYECIDPPANLLHAGERSGTEWEVCLRFQADTLRAFDPRPIVTQLVMEVQGLYCIKDRLFTVLSELYSNALEHGLLRLDSSLKKTQEGFSRYYARREALLSQPVDGWIRLSLRHEPQDVGGRLSIEVEDSGEGFDSQSLPARLPDQGKFSGRGMALLERLCDEVVYQPPGNQVRVSIDWGRPGSDAGR